VGQRHALPKEESEPPCVTQSWPPMNVDERRLKTKRLSSEIRVHLRSSAANESFSAAS
jgi:hypothetical protein